MITLTSYLMGRYVEYPINDQLKAWAQIVVDRANQLVAAFAHSLPDDAPYPTYLGVRSGYRPVEINAQIPNAATNSKHITCQAIDIEDNGGQLKSWCLNNLDQLARIGLWMEAPECTATWVHVQIVPPPSGHRVFIP